MLEEKLTMFLGSQIMHGTMSDLIKNVQFEKKKRDFLNLVIQVTKKYQD